MASRPEIRIGAAQADPPAVEWVNADSDSPILLVCEHAGQAIPADLEGLGLAPGVIDLHVGWDIGAEDLARALADRLGAPLILQRYSRLVIDCNRPKGTAWSIPEVSDRIEIPGNIELEAAARRWREETIFDPLDRAFATGFDRAPRKAAFSIHSFTRQLQDERRLCDAGFLTRRDTDAARILIDTIGAVAPDLKLALNEPYRIEDDGDWFIPAHAEPRGVRHALVEVCNDQLRDAAGVARWADLLALGLRAVLAATP